MADRNGADGITPYYIGEIGRNVERNVWGSRLADLSVAYELIVVDHCAHRKMLADNEPDSSACHPCLLEQFIGHRRPKFPVKGDRPLAMKVDSIGRAQADKGHRHCVLFL